MPRLAYKNFRFKPSTKQVIARAIQILEEYEAQGYDLTLRQLYYQFVARGLIANNDKEYNRLGKIVNDARLAGLIDWDHITDRTRNLRSVPHWASPGEIMEQVAKQFRVEKWADQPTYVEVWIEKDALVGVIEGICTELDVPYFSCRGYTSQSEMWSAGHRRLLPKVKAGKVVRILHLGDHDPSGIDMTRDIEERIMLFIAVDLYRAMPGDSDEEWMRALEQARDHFYVDRLALNMDQVDHYNPPPNPAKLTDARARGYIAEYGRQSWELDALEPSVLTALIRDAVEEHRDDDLWDAAVEREDEHRDALATAAGRWSDVTAFLNGGGEA